MISQIQLCINLCVCNYICSQSEILFVFHHLFKECVPNGTRWILVEVIQHPIVPFYKISILMLTNETYTCGKKEIHPYYISPIEMRSLWMEIECVKSATRLLNRIWVNKGGLDLSKEVLWVSVGQRAADLRAVKVGGQQKILPISPRAGEAGSNRAARQNFFLTSNFDGW